MSALDHGGYDLGVTLGEGRYEDRNYDGPVPILLQMGKVGRDCFNMDVQHPLSILQAFAICLSRFDTKSKWS